MPTSETTEMIRTLFASFDDTARASLTLPTVTEFTHNDRLYTSLVATPEGPIAYVCGSLADVLSCCSNLEIGGQSIPLTREMRELLQDQARLLAKSSVATICIAKRLSPYTSLSRPSALQTKMTLVGYLAIGDPVEADLAQLIDKCKVGGIRIAVLTESMDDKCNPAVEAGIFSQNTQVLTTLEQIDDLLVNTSIPDTPVENLHIFVRDKAERMKAVQKIIEHIPETVYVGDKLQDIPLFGVASAAVAADNHFDKSPQCMFSAADASVQHDTDFRASGAADSIRVISACKGAFARLRGMIEFLMFTQTLRLVVMLAAAFLGVPMLTPVQLLWWGMILDLMAVLAFSFSRRDDDALVRNSDAPLLPTLKSGLLFPVAAGVLAGLLLSLSASFSLSLFSHADESPIIYVGGLLSSCLFLLSIRSVGKTHSLHINMVGILYGILFIITIAVSVWATDLRLIVFALLPPLTVPVLCFFYLRLGRDVQRKN